MSWDWSESERRALEAYLHELGVCAGPITTRRIGDGHSNLTFLVGDGVRHVVVRRPPPPPIPPGAHDVLREATLMKSLEGSEVPVPRVLGMRTAGELLDVPLFVMSHVEGFVVTTETPSVLRNSRRSIAESLVDTLAALHQVDWRARALSSFGKPEGFNARHVRRMRTLVAAEDGTPPEAFVEIDAWIGAHVPPESGATIVHNDFRLGNVILSPEPPGRVAAVLDWELATLGDPLFDIAYLLGSVPTSDEPITATGAMGTALLEAGYPSRQALADRYARKTGFDLGNLRWYTAVVFWKLAVLFEYGRRRAATDHGDSYYADPAHVRTFLEAAHRAAGLAS